MLKTFDVIVVGAGAAGLMCAREAGARGRKVLVLERSESPGRKILISGGGRCNFTNRSVNAGHFLSQNPHYCKSALKQFSSQCFIEMVEQHQIVYYEKMLGQLFCKGSAKEILKMLLDEVDRVGVVLAADSSIDAIRFENNQFEVTVGEQTYHSASLVIATGGLSIPKVGATEFGYKVARQFGVTLTETRPGLVPLLFSPADLERFEGLAGLSFEAEVRCDKKVFCGSVLITHRGLSGPAILQISSYWKPGDTIRLRLIPDRNPLEMLLDARKRKPKSDVRSVLNAILPKRFVERICLLFKCDQSLGQTGNDRLKRVAHALTDWEVIPSGTEGYEKAEVTLGGVDTNALSSKTMEAREVPGLFFIGEVVDVTGNLGGFNFQWAWSSGYCAGQCV